MSQGSMDWDEYFSSRSYAYAEEETSSFVTNQIHPNDGNNIDKHNHNHNRIHSMDVNTTHLLPPQHFNIDIGDPRPPPMISEELSFNTTSGYGSQLQLSLTAKPQQVSVDGNVAAGSYTKGPNMGHQGLAKGSGASVGRPSERKKTKIVSPEEAAEQNKQNKIKNRLSSAKYRAKKKAYTDALENRLGELVEENYIIKQSEAEAARKRRQELEEISRKRRTTAAKTAEKFRALRRTSSFPSLNTRKDEPL